MQAMVPGSGGMRLKWLAAIAAAACALPCAASDNAMLNVNATVLSRALCGFNSNAALAINIPAIDPSGTATASGSTTTSFRCIGFTAASTYAVTANNGLYSPSAGIRRLRHATNTTEFMDYSLAISPASGPAPFLASVNITITASIAQSAYGFARAGNYSDTVVITVAP